MPGERLETRAALAVALCAMLAGAGCGVSGEHREVDLDMDLTAPDIAYFRELGSGGYNPVEKTTVRFPLYIPAFTRDYQTDIEARRPATGEDGEPAREPAGGWPVHVHIEDYRGYLFWILGNKHITNWDAEGRLVTSRSRTLVVLGLLLRSDLGVAVNPETGERVGTSGFEILCGLFGTYRDISGRRWRLFWFPFG